MTKLTTAAVVIFMLTSLSLAYFYGHRESSIKKVAPVQSGESVPVTPSAPIPAQK